MKKKVKKLNERNKISGITLIALVVMIVVLLILASITINLLFGDNGVITQAQDAKDSSRGKEIQEVIDTAVLENERVDYSGSTVKTKEDVISDLQEQGDLTDEEVETLKIADTLQIGSVTVDFSELGSKIDAITVSENASEYYGALVENYNVKYDDSKDATNAWRIFYSDGTNIYLIADDYIHYNYAPTSANYTIYKNSNYNLSFDNVYNDYTGSVSINSDFAKKWLSSYWKNNSASTNINIRAVAYMLDTSIWNKFVNSDYAEYAIGGPTIEMFCASYKDTHPTSYIECEAETSTNGYKVRWNGGSYSTSIQGLSTSNECNGIYIKNSTTKSIAMWLASPSANNISYVMLAGYKGNVNYHGYNHTYIGLRPLVCLSSDVQLEKLENGNYKIVKKAE